ncbi:MAG TPA: disulfide bond formation protein B [Allosphingosinicella sp.]|nr:disulfide bond formation protein B [Allosphingosinicella sp.]
MTSLDKARALAIAVPAALLAGAYGSEIWGGLYPCEMCWWQRYAHFAALALALLSLALRRAPDRGRSFVWLAALAILVSGGIGAYHAGVEAGIFEGFTTCTSTAGAGLSSEELLKQIMAAPIVRCDEIQFSFLGISMAGWNAILSILAALSILWLSLRRPRAGA